MRDTYHGDKKDTVRQSLFSINCFPGDSKMMEWQKGSWNTWIPTRMQRFKGRFRITSQVKSPTRTTKRWILLEARVQQEKMLTKLGGAFNDFFFPPRNVGKWSDLTNIFRWVENWEINGKLQGVLLTEKEINANTETNMLGWFFHPKHVGLGQSPFSQKTIGSIESRMVDQCLLRSSHAQRLGRMFFRFADWMLCYLNNLQKNRWDKNMRI